jgi:hypothetical protein
VATKAGMSCRTASMTGISPATRNLFARRGRSEMELARVGGGTLLPVCMATSRSLGPLSSGRSIRAGVSDADPPPTFAAAVTTAGYAQLGSSARKTEARRAGTMGA